MSFLTHDEFIDKVNKSGSKYWHEGIRYRWEYMDYAIRQAQTINPARIIEAGASGIPLNSESYLFDFPAHNLDQFPYCMGGEIIPDKYFDLFIALQTWEHLDNQQSAFVEVMRISSAAILSFPYKWTWGDSRHRGIDDAKISKWTCGVAPITSKIINHRKVFVWRFD